MTDSQMASGRGCARGEDSRGEADRQAEAQHADEERSAEKRDPNPELRRVSRRQVHRHRPLKSRRARPRGLQQQAPAAPGLTSRPRAPSCSLGGAGPGPLAAVRLARWTLVATVAPRRTAGISIPVAYPGCDFPLRRWSRAERVNGAAVGPGRMTHACTGPCALARAQLPLSHTA